MITEPLSQVDWRKILKDAQAAGAAHDADPKETFGPHDPEVMITCHDELLPAYVKAGSERHAGRLIAVCPDCTAQQVKTKLSVFPNLTHGFCPACARVRMAELERERVPEELTAHELMARAGVPFSTRHAEPWRNRRAGDLNRFLPIIDIVACEWNGVPVEKANALLRILDRVALADGIEREGEE